MGRTASTSKFEHVDSGIGFGGMQKKDGEVQPGSPKRFTQCAKSCSGVCAVEPEQIYSGFPKNQMGIGHSAEEHSS